MQTIFTLSCIFVLIGLSWDIGRHNSSLSEQGQIEGLKVITACQANRFQDANKMHYQALATSSYVANMIFIKLSIAIFLLRIPVKRIYIYILKASMSIVAIWSIIIFFLGIFQRTSQFPFSLAHSSGAGFSKYIFRGSSCLITLHELKSPEGMFPRSNHRKFVNRHTNPKIDISVEGQCNFTIQGAKCLSGASFVSAAYLISVMTIVSDWLFRSVAYPYDLEHANHEAVKGYCGLHSLAWCLVSQTSAISLFCSQLTSP